MLKICMHVQSAIASTPTAAWQGYLLGGIMWFCIPFTLSTGLGLATVACDLPVSVDEANMVSHLVQVLSAKLSSSCSMPSPYYTAYEWMQ